MSDSDVKQNKKRRWWILIPIFCTIGAIAAVTTTLCLKKCSFEPAEKTINIKLVDGKDMPSSIELDEEITIAAFDNKGNKIDGAEFSVEGEAASIDENNKVKGLSVGTAKIKCTAAEFDDAECNLEVTLKQIILEKEGGGEIPSDIRIGEDISVVAYNKDGTQLEDVTFTADPTGIVEIVENKITGINKGNTTITCKLDDPKYGVATFDLQVNLQTMEIKLLNGQPVPESIRVDQSIELAAFNTVSGEKVTDVVFTTDDETISLSDNTVTGVSIGFATISCTKDGYEDAICKLTVTTNAYDITLDAGTIDYYDTEPSVVKNIIEKELEVTWDLKEYAEISSIFIYNTGDDIPKYKVTDIQETGFTLPKEIVKQMSFEKMTIQINITRSHNANVICGEGIVIAQVKSAEYGQDIEIESELVPGYQINTSTCKVINSQTGVEIVTNFRVVGNKLIAESNDEIDSVQDIDIKINGTPEIAIYQNIKIVDDEGVTGRIRSRVVTSNVIIDVVLPPSHSLSVDETTGTNVVVGETTYYSDKFTYVENQGKVSTLTIPTRILPVEDLTESITINLVSITRQIKSEIEISTGFGFDENQPYEIINDKADKDFEVEFSLAGGYKLSNLTHLTYATLITPDGGSQQIYINVDVVNSNIKVDINDLKDMLEQNRGKKFEQCYLEIHAGAELA